MGTRRLAVAVVEAKKAEKLPVMMLHAEKHVGSVEKQTRGRSCPQAGPLQAPRPCFRAAEHAGGDDVGTRRRAVAVVEAKKAEKLPIVMLHAEKHVGSVEKQTCVRSCPQAGPSQVPRPCFRAAEHAGGDDVGTRRRAVVVVESKDVLLYRERVLLRVVRATVGPAVLP